MDNPTSTRSDGEEAAERRRAEERGAREAFRKQYEAEVRRAERVMSPPDCLCADHFPDLRREDHDRVLAIERSGIRGVTLLLEDFASRQESMREPGHLSWFELHEFIHMHSWQDPVAMYRLGSLASFWMQAQDERDRLKHPGLYR